MHSTMFFVFIQDVPKSPRLICTVDTFYKRDPYVNVLQGLKASHFKSNRIQRSSIGAFCIILISCLIERPTVLATLTLIGLSI